MASPKTFAFNLGVQKRAEVTRAEVQARYAASHPSKPRTSSRWMGVRTKGAPYSRTVLKKVFYSKRKGEPARLLLQHPTRGGTQIVKVTPDLLSVFFPSIPTNLAAAMLGN